MIVDFPQDKQFIVGEAFCIQCKHEWVAVAIAGTIFFECPNCCTHKGLLKYPIDINEGEVYRECRCGNSLFRITPEGHLCPNCGIYQNYE